MISRRMVLAGLLAGVTLPAFAEVMESSPRPRARGGEGRPAAATTPTDSARLIEAAKLSGAAAFAVADARTGAVLEAREPDLALPPASGLSTAPSSA